MGVVEREGALSGPAIGSRGTLGRLMAARTLWDIYVTKCNNGV